MHHVGGSSTPERWMRSWMWFMAIFALPINTRNRLISIVSDYIQEGKCIPQRGSPQKKASRQNVGRIQAWWQLAQWTKDDLFSHHYIEIFAVNAAKCLFSYKLIHFHDGNVQLTMILSVISACQCAFPLSRIACRDSHFMLFVRGSLDSLGLLIIRLIFPLHHQAFKFYRPKEGWIQTQATAHFQ